MTKFEYYTHDPARLADLLYMAVDDALAAKGCSLNLTLPEKLSGADDDIMVTWESLLMEEW